MEEKENKSKTSLKKMALAAFAFFLFNTCLNELKAQEKSQKLYVVVSGTVTEKGSGETLPGINVFCDSINVTVPSNNYGF